MRPLGLVVLAPGMGLRFLVTLSVTAAHALLLWLATLVEGPRVHGLWWVIGVSWVAQWLPSKGDLWWSLAVEEPAAAFVYSFGLVPALVATTTWALLDAEHRWARSATDAFGLALLPSAILADGLRWSGVGAQIPGGRFTPLALALAVPGLGLAGVALTRSRGLRLLHGLAVGLPGVVVLGSLVVGSALTQRDVLERIADPGLFYGDVDAPLELLADDPGVNDLDVLEARLDALGIEGALSPTQGGASLMLFDVSTVEAVLDAVLPRHALSLRAVVEDGHDEPIDVAMRPRDEEQVARVLRAVAERGSRALSVPLGDVWAQVSVQASGHVFAGGEVLRW